MQEIQLDKHIKLLDCPGVVLDKTSTTDSVALKNVVSSGNIEDPIACAATIVGRVTKDQVPYFSEPIVYFIFIKIIVNQLHLFPWHTYGKKLKLQKV